MSSHVASSQLGATAIDEGNTFAIKSSTINHSLCQTLAGILVKQMLKRRCGRIVAGLWPSMIFVERDDGQEK